MAKYQKFDDVPVWQEAARLYGRVLDVLEEPNTPLSATFRNQLERASLGVAGSVAEAFDASKGPDVIFLLTNARGAAMEVQSMIAVISDRSKVARIRDPLQQIRGLAESCARQVGLWRNAIENPGQGKRASSDTDGPSHGGTRAQATGNSGSSGASRSGLQAPSAGGR